jgi:hypothetical protein
VSAERDELLAHLEAQMDPADLQRILHGDPDAPKPRGVLDLRNSLVLRRSGALAPFSGGPIPQWVKDGKR